MMHAPARDTSPPGETLPARETLQERIYRHLRERIMAGAISPGQPLSIRGIAAETGASAMPVRDALRRLEAEGAIVPGPNRALTVPALDLAGLREVRDIRLALEGLAGERAAAHVTPDLLTRGRAGLAAMDAAVAGGDVAAYLAANWAFHRAIYAASALPRLTELIESLWLKMGPQIRMVAVDPGHFAVAMAAHRRIFAALEAGDGAGVRAGIADDINAAAADYAGRLTAGRDVS